MSKVGRKHVTLPAGVTITVDKDLITVKGAKEALSLKRARNINVEVEGNEVIVTRDNDGKAARAAHGMTRAIIANMVTGVTEGYTKTLEIVGVGYRAAMQGSKLVLSLGYSHPVEVTPPAGITFAVDGNTTVLVKGADKQVVGQVASEIRAWRAPEPYKGKGIRYKGEFVRRKAGKAGSK